MKKDLLSISSATNRAGHWLYSAGIATTAAFAGTATYFGSAYYVTTTQKILVKQLPFINNSASRAMINTLGVPGTSIRYISQIYSLISKTKQLLHEPAQSKSTNRKIFLALFTLLSAGCAGIGAFMLADIQAEEYEFQYDPTWLAAAIPLFLGGMEAIEAVLGGMDIENIKKLYAYLKVQHDNDITSISTEGRENFPRPKITRGITLAGSTLILFSFATIVDEFRRNILEEKNSPNNSIGFIIGILGNLLQMLLDMEKLSEFLQKINKKEIAVILGTLSLALAFTSSSLSFILGYEFGETFESSHEASMALGIFASLPKAITSFMFVYPALEYANAEISLKIEAFKKSVTERSNESRPLLSSNQYSINASQPQNNNCCENMLNRFRFF